MALLRRDHSLEGPLSPFCRTLRFFEHHAIRFFERYVSSNPAPWSMVHDVPELWTTEGDTADELLVGFERDIIHLREPSFECHLETVDL